MNSKLEKTCKNYTKSSCSPFIHIPQILTFNHIFPEFYSLSFSIFFWTTSEQVAKLMPLQNVSHQNQQHSLHNDNLTIKTKKLTL